MCGTRRATGLVPFLPDELTGLTHTHTHTRSDLETGTFMGSSIVSMSIYSPGSAAGVCLCVRGWEDEEINKSMT